MVGAMIRACVGIWGTQTPSPGVISPSPPVHRAMGGMWECWQNFCRVPGGECRRNKTQRAFGGNVPSAATSPVGLTTNSSAFGYLRLGAFALGHWQSFELHLEHQGPSAGSAAAVLPHRPAPAWAAAS